MLGSVKDHIGNIPDIMMHLIMDLTPSSVWNDVIYNFEDPVSSVVLSQLNRAIYNQIKENLHGAEIS